MTERKVEHAALESKERGRQPLAKSPLGGTAEVPAGDLVVAGRGVTPSARADSAGSSTGFGSAARMTLPRVQINRSYPVKLLVGATKNVRIPWSLPGHFALRTNMPSLLEFRHDAYPNAASKGEEDYVDGENDSNGRSGTKQFFLSSDPADNHHGKPQCFIRVRVKRAQHAMRAKLLIFIHKIVMETTVSQRPTETLELIADWVHADAMPPPKLKWKRLMRNTSFDRTQLEILAERFWRDTCAFGTPGKMPRAGFERLMGMLLRSTAEPGQVVDGGSVAKVGPEIPDDVLEKLWLNFNRSEPCDDDNSSIKELTFEMLVQGMDAAWKDTHFHLVAARAEYAAKNDAAARQRDMEDRRAREDGAYVAPLRPNDHRSLSPENLLAKAIESMSMLSYRQSVDHAEENVSAATAAAAAAIAAMAALNNPEYSTTTASVADKLAAAAAAAAKKTPLLARSSA